MASVEQQKEKEKENESAEQAQKDCDDCDGCCALASKTKSKLQLGVLIFATLAVVYSGSSSMLLVLVSTNQNVKNGRIWIYGASVALSFVLAILQLALFMWLHSRFGSLSRRVWSSTLVTIVCHYLSTSLCVLLSMRQLLLAQYMPLLSVPLQSVVISSNTILSVSIALKLVEVHKRHSLYVWGSRTARVTSQVVIVLFLVFVHCSRPLCAFVLSVSNTFRQPDFASETLLCHLGLFALFHLLLFSLFYALDLTVDGAAAWAALRAAVEFVSHKPWLSAHDRMVTAEVYDSLSSKLTQVCCPWKTSHTLRVLSILVMVFCAQVLDDALMSAGNTYAVPYTSYMIGLASSPMSSIMSNYLEFNASASEVNGTVLVAQYTFYLAVTVVAGSLAGVAVACALLTRVRTFPILAKLVATISFISTLSSFTFLATPCDLTGANNLTGRCNTTSSSSTTETNSENTDYSFSSLYGVGDMRAGLNEPVAQLGLVGMSGIGGSYSSTGSSYSASNVCPVVATYCGAGLLVSTAYLRQILLASAICKLLPARSKWCVLLAIRLFAWLLGSVLGPPIAGLLFNTMCVPSEHLNNEGLMSVDPCETLCSKGSLGLNVVVFLFALLGNASVFALLTAASCVYDSDYFHTSSQDSVLQDGTSASSSNSLSLAPSHLGSWSKLIHLHDHDLIIEMNNIRAHIDSEQNWSQDRSSRSVSLQDNKSSQSNTPVRLDSADLTELKRRNLYTVWKGRARSFSLDSKNSTVMRFRVELDADGTLQKTLVVVEAQVHDAHAPVAEPLGDNLQVPDSDSLHQSEIDGVINDAFSLDSDDSLQEEDDSAHEVNNNDVADSKADGHVD